MWYRGSYHLPALGYGRLFGGGKSDVQSDQVKLYLKMPDHLILGTNGQGIGTRGD